MTDQLVKLKNDSPERSRKCDGIRVRIRLRAFSYYSDPTYDSITKIQWKPDCWSQKQHRKNKLIRELVLTLFDWLSASAYVWDSSNLVFTRTQARAISRIGTLFSLDHNKHAPLRLILHSVTSENQASLVPKITTTESLAFHERAFQINARLCSKKKVMEAQCSALLNPGPGCLMQG